LTVTGSTKIAKRNLSIQSWGALDRARPGAALVWFRSKLSARTRDRRATSGTHLHNVKR